MTHNTDNIHLCDLASRGLDPVALSWFKRNLPPVISVDSLYRSKGDYMGYLNWLKQHYGADANYHYNSKGLCVLHQDPIGPTVHYVYDDLDRLITRKCGDLTIQYTYDDNNRLISHSDSIGRSYSCQYTPHGHLSTETSTYPSGATRSSNYIYDSLGRLIHKNSSDGRYKDYTYSDLLLDSTRDSNNINTTYTYDDRGNLTSLCDTAHYWGRYTYDSHDNPTSFQDSHGYKWSKEYDHMNRIVLDQSTNTVYKTLTYDKRGNIDSITNKDGTRCFNYTRLIGRLVLNIDGRPALSISVP